MGDVKTGVAYLYSRVLGGTQTGCAWAFGRHGSFGISFTGPWGIFGLGSGSAALLPSSNDKISNPDFRATGLDRYLPRYGVPDRLAIELC